MEINKIMNNSIFKEICVVISNENIALNIYEAILQAPKISSVSKPGQFINILPSKTWNNVMRRPMSIAWQKNNQISVIYKVFGDGTYLMSNWKKGDEIDIIGPLGNHWSVGNKYYPILIGGGVGIAPIMNLHLHLNENNISHSLIMGARDKEEHFMKHDPSNNVFLSTEKDDMGFKGNVIDALDLVQKDIDNRMKIYSCGPPGMMNAVRKYALNQQLECDLALETIMACGVGICQGCTIVRNSENKDTYREKYALACIDGPIFNIKELDDACFIH